MSLERYRQAASIFQAAVELDPLERVEFLERVCSGDAELKREVLSLLEHDAQASEFLEKPAVEKRERKPGSHIGPYEILEPIGAGGMGEVYRARDPRFGREVAIKLLPDEFTRDPDRVARFEREALAAGPLNHPNILTVYDCGRQDGVPYIVSELLQGETLRRRMEQSSIRPATAVAYAAQIARGLGEAHSGAIVHRDLKPENIFIAHGGVVKILDFGLAKLPAVPTEKADGSPVARTQAGMVMGTFGYMSPEQLRSGQVDHRSDIFSLGVILYEMLTRTRPFAGDTWAEEASAILGHEPPDLPREMAGIADPAALARIVRRCLAKQPEDRFQSARDLAFALDSLLEQGTLKPVRHRVRFALAGITLAAVLVTIAFLIVADRGGPSLAFQRVTFRRGIVSAARFTSDGNTIVYSAAWDVDDLQLYWTRANSTDSNQLGHSPAMLFAVSSQGQLAMCRPTGRTQHGFIGTLARVPLTGGGARPVAENVTAADWSPDGSDLAVVRVENDREQIEFPVGTVKYRPPLSGGYMEALRVAPRGDAIAFLDHPLLDDSAGWVALIDLQGTYRVLSSRFNSMRGLAWSPDGREVWFAAARRGTNMAVWAVNRSGKERVVARFPAYTSLEDLSADGRALVSFHTLSNSLIHVSAAGTSKDLYWHDQSQVQELSRDGGSILFSESGDATREDYDAYLRQSDGSLPAERLGVGLPLSLSPDGQWVIANPAGSPAPLTLLPIGSGAPKTLAADNINHLGAAWLPDGRAFIFAGIAPGESLRYYVQPLSGGRPRPITAAGIGFERRSPIVVSPDGRFVAAVDADKRVAIYPTASGQSRALPDIEPGFTPLQWCPDDSLVLFRYDQQPPQLLKADVRTGKLTPWRTLNPPDLVGLLDLTPIRVSRDCQTYAYSPLTVHSQVYLITGLR
jgi:Tol biopolymer transport system component